MTQTPEQAALQVIRDAIRGTEWENQVFVAGGYVRDELLGRQSKDVDLVITAEDGGLRFAEWITRLFGCYSLGNPVVFPRFGTAKFYLHGCGDVQIECVMPRSEAYTPGSRKPDVSFTSLEEDAKRRDFTVNSLYRNVSTGELIDFTGGVLDIKRGIIRTSMDPNVIFVDDPLRMLRAVRFAVRFDWAVDPMLLLAMKEKHGLIANISQERITDELSKILVSDDPTLGFKFLWLTDLLRYVMPEVFDLINVIQNKYHVDDVFDHTLEVVQNTPPDLVTRLTALFHDIGKERTWTMDKEDKSIHFYQHEEVGAEVANIVLHRMKFPTHVINSVVKGVANHMRLKQSGEFGEKISDKALRKLRVDLGDDLSMILDVMHADNLSHHPDHIMPHQIPGIRARLQNLGESAPQKVTLPIDGNDVMRELSLAPGPKVRKVLDAVKEEWFANPNLTREDALKLIHSLTV